jgi:AraC family transcriptional regulator
LGRSGQFVRSVGGNLVASSITNTSSMRLEVLRRETTGRMHWHFRQPEAALFMFGPGTERLQATVDGRKIDCPFSGRSKLAIFPASTEIVGEWNVGTKLDYTVVFLNPAFVGRRYEAKISQPIIGFSHDVLERGLIELIREATSPDDVFDMMAEGWTIQALAHLARVHDKCSGKSNPGARGGLPGCCVKRLEEFVRANLSESICLDRLSDIAGISKRHFLRAFQESVGAST